jgi:signal transduction histidine kinase
MQGELERIQCFVTNLMDFAVPQSVKRPLDLVNFIEKELFFLRPQNRFDDIRFETDFERRLPLVEADQGQLQQLFYNLMNNAADALKPIVDQEKTISIKVRHLADQGEVEIKIQDNGIGISKDMLPKVFKERFTTKEKGHGFGLLSVRRAVENHHGSVQVKSKDGVGAEFVVILPVKQPASAEAEDSAAGEQPVCLRE